MPADITEQNEKLLTRKLPLTVTDRLLNMEDLRSSPPPGQVSSEELDDDNASTGTNRSSHGTNNPGGGSTTRRPNIPEVVVEPAADPPAPVEDNNVNGSTYLDIWAAAISIQNRNLRNTNMGTFNSAHVYGINSGIITSKLAKTPQPIPQNAPRLLYYVEEPSKGKGFIKELCFSADGRVICSPYDQGIRLLAFAPECFELSRAVDVHHQPKPLHEIKIINCHPDIVVSVNCHPRYPSLVSGCLSGKIVWHQPRF